METERQPEESSLFEEGEPLVEGEEGSPSPEQADLSQLMGRAAAVLEAELDPGQEVAGLPRQPANFADVGLSRAFLTDLTLKILHYASNPSAAQLMRRLGLPQGIVQQLLSSLAEERLCEVMTSSDLYTGNYRYRLTSRGEERVREALERTRYAGPAPVPVSQYARVMKGRPRHQLPSRGRIKDALADLVLAPAVADAVARALYSGKSAIFYGPSGNGKTSILERFARHTDGVVLMPYAIYAHGQVIRVFDPSLHTAVEELNDQNVRKDEAKVDRRWVLVKQPTIIVGAELDRESLDLAYDPISRFYQAPPHIKAQGGLFIVDDLGRQKIPASDLLARWLIPLERGWDSLTLATGEKVALPFEVQLLMATNLPIHELADEAFLRRILYKVEIPNPTPSEFADILQKLCRQRRVLVPQGAIDYVVKRLYEPGTIQPRAVYARDLLEIVIESAKFDGREPVLDAEAFDKAFHLFVREQAPAPQS